MGPEGRILFALAEGPLSLGELESATEMRRELLQDVLHKMAGYTPPAVVNESGKYRTKVPIFTASDFSLLLSECDRVAQDIHCKVVRPHAQEEHLLQMMSGLRLKRAYVHVPHVLEENDLAMPETAPLLPTGLCLVASDRPDQ